MSDSSWSVVCTADEPLPLLAAFALHYLGLGASEVHLFLDNPRPGHAAFLAGIDGIRVTECNEAYWQGKRKRAVENRQQHNAFQTYRKTETDWMIHLDCDEFLYPPEGARVGTILAAEPEERDVLVVPVRERVYRMGEPVDGLFTGATVAPYRYFTAIEEPTPVIRRRGRFSAWGLLVHSAGKSFLRTGQPLVVGIHRPRPGKDHPLRHLGRDAFRMHTSPSLQLAHFDGITPFHWVAKLWRMAKFMPEDKLALQTSGRRKLIRRARATLPEVAPLRSLGQGLRDFDPATIAKLRAAGIFHELQNDPAEAVIARGLLPAAAYQPDAFDVEMTRMYPEAAPLLDDWRTLERATVAS